MNPILSNLKDAYEWMRGNVSFDENGNVDFSQLSIVDIHMSGGDVISLSNRPEKCKSAGYYNGDCVIIEGDSIRVIRCSDMGTEINVAISVDHISYIESYNK